MRVLLDTHTLLWLVSNPSEVDPGAREILADPETAVSASAASAWEISTKARLGRLDGEPFLSAWNDILADMSTTEVSITSADAILAGRLPWDHRDPFDRVIVAQAVRRNLTIATRDSKIIKAGIAPTLRV